MNEKAIDNFVDLLFNFDINELENETKFLEKYKKLQQENAQLKENNLAMQEEMARTWEKEDKLKSVLKEIREYIDEFIIYVGEDGEIYFKEEFSTEYNDLLEIIDKGIGEDNG